MFGDLAGKAAEALGRAYFLTGLMPALLLATGLAIAVELDVPALADDAPTLGIHAAMLLLTSLVFAMSRELIVHLYELLPGTLLAPLRNRLELRALKRRRRLQRRIAQLEVEYTAVRWILDGPQASFVPDWLPSYRWARVQAAANDALRRVSALRARRDGIVPQRQARRVVAGLLRLYVFVARNPLDAHGAQLYARWRGFVESGEDARQVLCAVCDHVQRELLHPVGQSNRMPDGTWLKPTRLGNVFSALDDYAEQRYGAPTYLVWERIWWLLGENDRREVGDARLMVAALLACSLAAAMLALFVSPLLLIAVLGDGAQLLAVTPLLVLVGAALGARLLYELAVVAACSLAHKVEALIDLQRLSLLRALGFAARSTRHEAQLFSELRTFWSSGVRTVERRYDAAES